ncbi:uncharacterized protein LOC117639201 isoform X2 [Thrips palmi]|uniref:Uncharacterized protein LOC117639201 isoform X2 n=1 Tax=Thrips palmi TaxID=161013 RepID=A0A6P8Y2J4_THRPL|nr:uncharacterized protein LOC117639201 isoform X2 [Thrips palmi]
MLFQKYLRISKMEAMEELNNDLLIVDQNVVHLKEKRREYLSTVRDVLDVYVLSVMEEEDPIFSLLSKRSQYHYNLKTTSPFQLQFKILMDLPFLHSDIQVERGEPGFVKLKLPNVEEGLMRSKVWTEACHRGIQKSLTRHINQWKDDSNYLKQTAVLGWLAGAVDKSLALVGTIPNYLIQRQHIRNKVVIQLEDKAKNMKFNIELLPVLELTSSQLPQQLADNPLVSQIPSCDTWSVECRSNEICNDQFWGISMWQHEKFIIRQHTNLKSVIHILKSLRDGCEWNILTNYHIRTLVLQAFLQDRMMFDIFSLAELLLQLLLLLRDKLVSREGLPCLWDMNYNLLSGLNGHQKSGLARAVTKRRDSLQKLSDNYCSFFRLETYSTAPTSRTSEAPLSESSTPTFQSFENTSTLSAPLPESGEQPESMPSSSGEQQQRTISSSEEQLPRTISSSAEQPLSRTSSSAEQPQRRTASSRGQPQSSPTSPVGDIHRRVAASRKHHREALQSKEVWAKSKTVPAGGKQLLL